MYYIKKYNTIYPNGYNLSKGGNGGDIFTQLTPENQEKKRKFHSDYFKKHNPMHRGSVYDWWVRKYGVEIALKKKREQIEKIRITKKNKRLDPLYDNLCREKRSQSIKNNIKCKSGFTAEHRQKLSEHNIIRNRKQEILQLVYQNTPIQDIANFYKISIEVLLRKLKIWNCEAV